MLARRGIFIRYSVCAISPGLAPRSSAPLTGSVARADCQSRLKNAG